MRTITVSAGGYHDWHERTAAVGAARYTVASKPGAIGYGRGDQSAMLLARDLPMHAGETIVQLHGATGLFAVHAATIAGEGGRVLVADRHVVHTEAVRRSAAANGLANITVVHGEGAGALPAGTTADLVAIRIPTAKAALTALLRDAFDLLRTGGRCAIAGASDEGIKSAAALLERLFGNARVLAIESGHRMLVATKHGAAPGADFPETEYRDPSRFLTVRAELRGEALELHTRPGVFSWEHADEATAILADALRLDAGARVLDLGCGAGPLGIVASRLTGGGPVTLTDADAEAVRSAVRSAEANGVTNARCLASDVAGAVLGERFDAVVTNPPFHTGKATDLDVPMQFIEDAHTVLEPGGRLWLVANRTLPYERAIAARFGNIETAHDGRRFKVLSAVRRSV